MNSSMKSRAQLDDTVPMKCTIESSYSVKDHTEYSVNVQFGPIPETSWKITKRYSDFAGLDLVLKNAGFELQLPPKKVFGKMESDFISKRQQGLQNYLNAILSCQWVSFSLDVKLFLCPPSFLNISYQDTALQNICMFLRSENNWELVEPLPYIGWRLRKCYFLVRDRNKPKDKYILTWCCSRPNQSVDVNDLEHVMKFINSLQHPGIEPAIFAACNNTCSVTVRKFYEKGTVRDQMCNAKPIVHYLKKYGQPKNCRPIPVPDIRSVGRHILETLKCLHDKGYPYVHLHAGNVVLCDGLPRLLDLENWAVGVPSLHRPLYTKLHRLQTLESIEMFSFGHLLYELATGRLLLSPTVDINTPLDNCTPEFKSLLVSVLGETASKTGPPSISSLLSNPFFRDVQLTPGDGITAKVSGKLREILKAGRDVSEQQLKDEQRLLHQHRKIATAEAFYTSPEEKMKRKLQKVKSMNEMSSQDPSVEHSLMSFTSVDSALPELPARSAQPPSKEAAAANHPPVPLAPPMNGVAGKKLLDDSDMPKKQPGREGLLSSIVGFKKSNMRKTETVDKSAPVL